MIMSQDPPNVSNGRRDIWLTGTSLTVVAAVAAAVFAPRTSPAVASSAAEPQASPVSVATVVQSEVTTWEEFSGRLEAVERVDIRSRVAGTVQAVHFREGALVRKGDLLLTIDPAPYAADVESAEAQVAAALARQSYAKSEYERAQRLLDERAIAQREADERIEARAALQTAQLALGYTQVRAPVTGRVGSLEITVGNLVAAGPGAPFLTTLVSVSPIYASFDADEQIVTRALKTLAFRDVEDQLSALRLLADQANAQAQAVAEATRSTALSTSRYRNGYVSQLELLDARRSELSNRREALQVRAAQYQATVGLIRALGGGWGPHRGSEPVAST
jgi:multidrug efflux pump subunit AcrA (membrane-fusion protein)